MWRTLAASEHVAAEAEWRSIYGDAFRGSAWGYRRKSRRPRMRHGTKADYEYLQQCCDQYRIVPFTADVPGTPIAAQRQRGMSAYECAGDLVPLGQFGSAEFFIAPLDFAWTMVHTHEDHAIDGPYFLHRTWVE